MDQRVLVISEDEEHLKEIEKAVAPLSFDLRIESEAVKGIEAALKFKPDLVILNLVMSGDGGLALLEKIKSTPGTKNIPIVMLMAMETDAYKDKITSLGVEAVIPKPFNAKFITGEIKRVLDACKKPAKKILVIDDDPLLVKMLSVRLTANGYEVVTLTDSEEAVRKVHSERPDLIIIDIMMPNVSGWTITQELKASKDFKHIPIILLSALIETEGSASNFEIGDYFMSKPVMVDKLTAKIEELLARKSEVNFKGKES